MIKNNDLNKMKTSFLSDNNNKIRRRVLNKVPITDLVTDQDTELEENFNINIKTHGVTDQKYSGRCWAFSAANILREKVIEKCNLENFELSLSYITFYEKLEKFNLSMAYLINYLDDGKGLYDRDVSTLLKIGICDGGYWTWFSDLVDKYGIVPKNVYSETFQSSNSSEINYILSRLLRKFYIEIEKSDDKNKVKEEYLNKAYKILSSVQGVPPEKFDFEYTDKDGKYFIDKGLTPKEFYDKYIGINIKDDYVELISYEDEKFKYNNLYTFEESNIIEEYDNLNFLNLSRKDFKDLIIKQLSTKELVCFSSYVSNKRIEGIWTDLLSRYGELLDIDLSLNSNEIIKTNEISGAHAMVISGLKTIDDKPVKWKIENSWGDKYGHKGDYIADDDWFNKYVSGAIINKKYLSDKQKELLLKKPITICKWDYKFD